MVYLQRESRSLSRYEKLVESFDKNFDENKLSEMEKKVFNFSFNKLFFKNFSFIFS